MFIIVLDTYMKDIRVFKTAECDDAQDWLYNNDPNYDASTCHYTTSYAKPTYKEINNAA